MKLDDDRHLDAAVRMAVDAARRGDRPFAALVVRDGIVVGEGLDQSHRTGDPTDHAEIAALRAGDVRLGQDTSRHVLYASCEPCLMCTAVIMRLRVLRTYYAATRESAVDAGLADVAPPATTRQLRGADAFTHVGHELADEPFAIWAAR